MTNVRMKAVDTLHVSSVKADNLRPGEEFEAPQYVADDLEARGLATRVREAKAEPDALENKMEPAPANKAAKASSKKRRK